MTKAADIFKEDGTLKGVGFVAASGNRGDGISVRARNGDAQLTTMYTLGDKDFINVYGKAVDALAGLHGIGKKSKLYQQMQDSFDRFLQSQGLKLQAVKVYQLVRE